MSEYRTVVKTIEIKPGIADKTGNEVAAEFALGLQKTIEDAQKVMARIPGEGTWEIVNHNMLRIDRHVIVSVLMKKQ